MRSSCSRNCSTRCSPPDCVHIFVSNEEHLGARNESVKSYRKQAIIFHLTSFFGVTGSRDDRVVENRHYNINLLCNLTVTWVRHDCDMTVTWLWHDCYDCNMIVTWLQHDCYYCDMTMASLRCDFLSFVEIHFSKFQQNLNWTSLPSAR